MLGHGAWFTLLSSFLLLGGVLLMNTNGPHEKHFEEIIQYLEFGLWWVALGVASSIGLGNTFTGTSCVCIAKSHCKMHYGDGGEDEEALENCNNAMIGHGVLLSPF